MIFKNKLQFLRHLRGNITQEDLAEKNEYQPPNRIKPEAGCSTAQNGQGYGALRAFQLLTGQSAPR